MIREPAIESVNRRYRGWGVPTALGPQACGYELIVKPLWRLGEARADARPFRIGSLLNVGVWPPRV